MLGVPTSEQSPAARRGRRFALGTALALALGAPLVLAHLGRGPAPITVTNTSGGATFNFRVTGIPVPGKIDGVTPDLTFSPSDLAATTGVLTVDLNRLDTGIALRDEHAKNFLRVKAHPTATFTLKKLSGVRAIREGQTVDATVIGTLDVGGVSAPLSAPVTLTYGPSGIDVTTTFDVTFKKHRVSIPGADPKTDVRVTFRLPVRR